VADTTIMLTGVNEVKRAPRQLRGHKRRFSMSWPGPCSTTPIIMWWWPTGLMPPQRRPTPLSAPSARPETCWPVIAIFHPWKGETCWHSWMPEAYGFSMASQYNGQPRPAEVLVSGDEAEVTRRREDSSALLAGQRILPRLMW